MWDHYQNVSFERYSHPNATHRCGWPLCYGVRSSDKIKTKHRPIYPGVPLYSQTSNLAIAHLVKFQFMSNIISSVMKHRARFCSHFPHKRPYHHEHQVRKQVMNRLLYHRQVQQMLQAHHHHPHFQQWYLNHLKYFHLLHSNIPSVIWISNKC